MGYLGSDIDQSVTGECVAKKVIMKANSRLKLLYRNSKYLDTSTRIKLMSALIQCPDSHNQTKTPNLSKQNDQICIAIATQNSSQF